MKGRSALALAAACACLSPDQGRDEFCAQRPDVCDAGMTQDAGATQDAGTLQDAGDSGSITAGLLLRWGFDEDGGSTVLDSSGNGVSGTLTTGTLRVPGRFCGAVETDGTGSTVDGPGLPSFGSASFSTFTWIRSTDSTPGQTRILGRIFLAPDGGVGSYFFFNFNAGAPWAEVKDDLSNYTALHTTGISIADGGWHHVGLAVDRDGGSFAIYVDGATAAKGPLNLDGGFGPMTNPFRLGAQTSGVPTLALQADFDDTRVYGRVLSADEVAALFAYVGCADGG